MIVQLKNVMRDQYLYADDDQNAKNSQLRSVYLCRTSRRVNDGTRWANWKMTANKTSYGTLKVRLAPVQYDGEYLVDQLGVNLRYSQAQRFAYSLRDRKTPLSKLGAVADWYLDLDPSGVANRYYIRSVLANELLHTPSYPRGPDRERQYVYIWTQMNTKKNVVSWLNAFLWDIQVISE